MFLANLLIGPLCKLKRNAPVWAPYRHLIVHALIKSVALLVGVIKGNVKSIL